MERRLLTEADAAKYLGLSRQFLRKSRSCGTLRNHTDAPPYVRCGGRAIRYDVQDLEAWIDSRRCAVKVLPEDAEA